MRHLSILLVELIIIITFPKITFANSLTVTDKIGVFGLPDDAAANDLGVTWTRFAFPQWKQYLANPTSFDDRLSKLHTTKVIATIRSVNDKDMVECGQDPDALLAVAHATDQVPQGKSIYDFISCMPKDLDSTKKGSYRDFITQAVAAGKGKVDAWQIENEVYSTITRFWLGDARGEFDNFITLFTTTSKMIRTLDPSTPILAPGITLGHTDFNQTGTPQPATTAQQKGVDIIDTNVRRLFTDACSNFDVIDLHLYYTVESIPGRVAWLQKIMNETGCIKPIWSTEISGPDPFGKQTLTDAQFVQQQADELGLRLQTAFNSGIEKVIYFIYQQVSGSTDQGVAKLGLVDDEGIPKSAYAQMQAFTKVSSSVSGTTKPADKVTTQKRTLPLRKIALYGSIGVGAIIIIGAIVVFLHKKQPPAPNQEL